MTYIQHSSCSLPISQWLCQGPFCALCFMQSLVLCLMYYAQQKRWFKHPEVCNISVSEETMEVGLRKETGQLP